MIPALSNDTGNDDPTVDKNSVDHCIFRIKPSCADVERLLDRMDQ